jgi:hypothetical protein
MDIRLRSHRTVTVKVGSVLAMWNINYNKRDRTDLSTMTVTKIGRKWITFVCDNGGEYQFNSEGGENSDYGHNGLYESEAEYKEIIETKKLLRKVEETLRRKHFTKSQITEVAYILDIKLDDNE